MFTNASIKILCTCGVDRAKLNNYNLKNRLTVFFIFVGSFKKLSKNVQNHKFHHGIPTSTKNTRERKISQFSKCIFFSIPCFVPVERINTR